MSLSLDTCSTSWLVMKLGPGLLRYDSFDDKNERELMMTMTKPMTLFEQLMTRCPNDQITMTSSTTREKPSTGRLNHQTNPEAHDRSEDLFINQTNSQRCRKEMISRTFDKVFSPEILKLDKLVRCTDLRSSPMNISEKYCKVTWICI